MWNLAICCAPESNADEVKVPAFHDEGIAIPVLPSRAGQAFNKVLPANCAEQCCQQKMDPNEVLVMPLTASMPVRNNAQAFIEQPAPIQGLAYSPSPLPVPGPPIETRQQITQPWPAHINSPYPQEFPPTPLPSPVPQIVGIDNLPTDGADQMRDVGDMVVELVRDGPQWSNLGVLVSQNNEDADNLNIDHIDELSLLGDWNAKLPKTQQVWEGDVIIAVNGCTGRELIRQIQDSSEKGCRVTLHVARKMGARPAG